MVLFEKLLGLAKEITAKYHPGTKTGYIHSKGIGSGQCLVEGIRLALEEIGYENLTGEAIRKSS